jgi:hypothetical protein
MLRREGGGARTRRVQVVAAVFTDLWPFSAFFVRLRNLEGAVDATSVRTVDSPIVR